MKTIMALGVAMAALLIFVSCTRHKTISKETITCGDRQLTLINKLEKNYMAQYPYIQLQVDGLKPFSLRMNNVPYAAPYADEVYGDAPRFYLKNRVVATKKEEYGTEPKIMLHIDGEIYSKEDFEKIHQTLQACSEKIWQYTTEHYKPTQIVGLVLGTEDDFAQKYIKTKDDYYVVYPSGRVENVVGVGISSGYLSNVKMPGKIIELQESSLMNIELLQYYKNERTGKTIDQDFKVIVKHE